jgi:choline dehydrogenase-like flavoprotein
LASVILDAVDGWSKEDLAVLAALAETFVPGDAEHRAELAAAALAASADPAQVRQLRLVLRLMDSSAANLLLTGRPRAVTSMPAVDREPYLLTWAASRLGLRRSAFAAFRKLLTFLAYADPGGEAANPRLARIGYRPDDPPVTGDPAAIRPHRLPAAGGERNPAKPIVLEADAVIVGSGAGGGVIAARLSAAGRSVVVLEAGPFVDEASMPRDELAAFDRLYLNHGLLTTWDGALTMLAGTGVGGGTLVNWMTCIPATASVRDEWERAHGIEDLTGPAWAGDLATLEDELGVAESTHIPPKDAVILRGARALGWDAAPTRRNASACGDCGSCPFGCRRGTKRSGMRAHLAQAAAAGARLVPDAHVTRLLLEGGRVVGVEAEVTTGGDGSARSSAAQDARRRLIVRAPVVIVAAGALRTPAVLQRSGLEHPAIGRYLRVHPVAVVAGRFDEPIEMWRGTMQGARSLEFVEAEAGRNGYVIESAPGHPGLLALALPWEGMAAHRDLMTSASRIAPLLAITRDGGEGRTTTTSAGRVRIDYRLDERGIATLRHGLVSLTRLARAAGATEVLAAGMPPVRYRPGGTSGEPSTDAARFEAALGAFDFGPNRGAVFSAHQMGTVRMGADRRTHPCDPWGRVRTNDRSDELIRGLYVGDGSLFPTGLGLNPMITVMALASRVARTVLADT